MTDPDHLRKAAGALSRAIDADPDDRHPDRATLEAFVDQALDDVEREVVDAHCALCAQCREDVADLVAVRHQIDAHVRAARTPGAAPAARRPMGVRVAVVAGLAAAALLAVRVFFPPASAPVPVAERAATDAAPKPAPPAAAPSPAGDGLPLSDAERGMVAAALAESRVTVPPAVRALRGTAGTLLGANARATIAVQAPLATAVRSDRPVFRWDVAASASQPVSFEVAVFDERFTQVATSGTIAATRRNWTPGAALPRGVALTWQVTARLADGTTRLSPAPPAPEARFMIVSREDAAAANALDERLAAHPLERGILLARAGLIDDARAALAQSADPRANKIIQNLR